MNTEGRKHTPGPWRPGHLVNDDHSCDCRHIFGNNDRMGCVAEVMVGKDDDQFKAEYPDRDEAKANMHLIAAAPDMLAALLATRALVSEAAQTGFNYATGDWAERLYANQASLSAAISRAEGKAS
jgi:hypothetical protein